MTTLIREIDEVDKRILSLLSQDPEISQSEISKRLGVSQPAVSARIYKLKEKGVLAHLIGVDIKKTQLFLAKIEVVTTNIESFLDFLNKCPIYFNSFLTSGRYQLTVFLIGENIRSLISCLDYHYRQKPFIEEMEFDIEVTPARDFIVPIKPVLDKKKITPCEIDCGDCPLYINDRCLGCPASIHYKGTLL
jgi:DNA-binding Lrp family transcriptional regulator